MKMQSRQNFTNDYEYEKEKRESRKREKEKRTTRQGKKNRWEVAGD